jgi:hypothetical protein
LISDRSTDVAHTPGLPVTRQNELRTCCWISSPPSVTAASDSSVTFSRRASRDPVERVWVGAEASAIALVERVDRRHLVVGEFEVEESVIFFHSLAADRLREDDVAVLDVPAQDHLSGGALVLCRDPADDGVVEVPALRQRAPRLDG